MNKLRIGILGASRGFDFADYDEFLNSGIDGVIIANDHYCTDPRTPDPYRLPTSKSGTPEVDENIYKAVQQRFASAHLKPGGN